MAFTRERPERDELRAVKCGLFIFIHSADSERQGGERKQC